MDNKELRKSHKILIKRLKKRKHKLSRNNITLFGTKPKSSIWAFFGRPLLGIRCSYRTHSASQVFFFSSQDLCGTASAFLSGNTTQRTELAAFAFSRTLEWAGELFPLRKWVICQQVSHPSANTRSFREGLLLCNPVALDDFHKNLKQLIPQTDNVLCSIYWNPSLSLENRYFPSLSASFYTSGYRDISIKLNYDFLMRLP